jgi:hypothetical protein
MRNVKVFTRGSFLKVSSKKFSFFYKFNNNEFIPSFHNFKDSINVDFLEGIKFAYRNLIEALYDRDYEFLEGACEESLAKKLEKSMNEYKDELFISSPKDILVQISSLKMECHIGISTSRYKNSLIKLEKCNNAFESNKGFPFNPNILNSLPGFENLFNFYKQQDNSILKYYVIRLNVDMKSNLILSRNSLNYDTTEIHNVLFELESTDRNILFNIFSKSSIMKAAGFYRNSDSSELPEKIIISDFDNVMNGNPLLKV